MTLAELQAMTDDEIRVRVAEVMGWKFQQVHKYISGPSWEVTSPTGVVIGSREFPFRSSHGPDSNHIPLKAKTDSCYLLPNWPASLDACAEFERGLTDEEYERYSTDLWRLVNGDQPRQESAPIRCERAYLSAKARHRCEAFLMTKGVGL